MKARIAGLRDYIGGTGLGPRVVRAAVGSAAVQAAGMALSFLVGVQLARGLGAGGYGIYGIAMAVITIAAVPGDLGLSKLVMREVASAHAGQEPGRLLAVIRWANRLSLKVAVPVAAIIALVGYFAVGRFDPQLALAIAIGAPIIPIIVLARIRGGGLQGLNHIVRGQVAVDLVRPLVLSILLLGLFAWSPDAQAPAAMALNGATAAIALLVSHIWLKRRLPRGDPAAQVHPARDWLASAIPMAMTDGLRIVQAQIGILALGVLVIASEVGMFRVALSIAAMVAVPISLANTVAAPLLARLHAQGDQRRLQMLCRRSAQFMTAGVLLFTLPFLLFGEGLIGFVFSAEFGGANPALLILCAGFLASAALGPNAALLNMTGNERRVTRAMAFALAGNGLAQALLIPSLGQMGAALATSFGMVIWNGLLWSDARRILGVDTSFLARRPRAGTA